jgi:hypothetical protein
MILDPILDLLRGKAVTIPPLDGAFRPNTALDDAPVFARMPGPDNLVLWQGQVLASSGPTLQSPDGTVLQGFAADVTALAVSAGGALAVALEMAALPWRARRWPCRQRTGCADGPTIPCSG